MVRSLIVCFLLTLVGSSSAWSAGLGEPRDIAFAADCDGTSQSYVLMLPEGFKPGAAHDLLIALHGHGSDRWQFAASPLEEAAAARAAAAAHGMLYVCPDYRAPTSWMGPKAEADLLQIIGALRRQYKVARVFISGASMGGASSLTFTALHPGLIAGVASMNGTANHLEYSNFQAFISASYGGPKSEIPLEYKRRSAEYWPERFTMPVAISASGKDELVPPQSVVRLADVLKKMDRKVLLIYREREGHRTSYDDAKALLEFVIQNAAKKN